MGILNLLNQQHDKMLRIIIVGAGKVGSTLADKLTAEGNNVTIIDKKPEVVNRLSTTYDIMGIVGNGSSYSTLVEAGVEDADLIIAVTESDELNLLCCTLARRFNNTSAIARVRTPDYSGEIPYLRDKLGISMIINPELEAAREISRILHYPSALSVNAFAKGSVDMVKFKLPEGNKLCGKSLTWFGSKNYDVLVCAVERGNELIIPDGQFEFAAGDNVSVIGAPQAAYSFLVQAGLGGHSLHSALIIGGGRSSYYLATRLRRSGIAVTIIEKRPERCAELSELLPDDVIIVNGDGSDESLLMQEDLPSHDAVIPLTGLDELNIILALYAMKANSDIKVITKVNHIGFKNVISELELGSVVYPRFMTAEMIRTYVRAKKNSIGSNIETLYRLFDDRAEAIEFKIDSKADYTNVPLRQLKLKKHLLIASIVRGGKSLIPGGKDTIQVGDTVIIVTTHSGFTNIKDIFA